jgi:hypothetical protein
MRRIRDPVLLDPCIRIRNTDFSDPHLLCADPNQGSCGSRLRFVFQILIWNRVQAVKNTVDKFSSFAKFQGKFGPKISRTLNVYPDPDSTLKTKSLQHIIVHEKLILRSLIPQTWSENNNRYSTGT